jgi:hypothetical protein
MISRVLSTSKKFAAAGRGEIGEFVQLVYTLLLPYADDFGRQEGDPFTVKHKVLPTSTRPESEFSAALARLRDAGLILWYDSDEGQVIEIVGFDEHQVGLHKRTNSRFSGKFPEVPESTALIEVNRTEQKGSEGKAQARIQGGGAGAGTYPRDHMRHGFCGSRFCVNADAVAKMVLRYGEDGAVAVPAWLSSLNDGLGANESAGGPLWVLQHFDAFLVASGRVPAAPVAKVAKPNWRDEYARRKGGAA